MEERRILNALLTCALVAMLYYTLYPPRRPARPSGETARATAAPVSPGEIAERKPEGAAAAVPAASPVPRVATDREYRVDVETPHVSLGFKNRGARLVSWKLVQPLYRDVQGQPEEMVQTTPDGPLPFDVETGEAAIDKKLRDALFRSSTEELKLSATERGSVVFEFGDGDIAARKEFGFSGDGYLIDVSVSVQQGGHELSKKVIWGPGLGHASAAEKALQGYQEPSGAALVDGKAALTPVKKIATGIEYGDVGWVGIQSRHFAALWVPPSGHGQGELREVDLPGEGTETAHPSAIALMPLGTSTGPALLYVGPKDYYQLKALGHDLVRIVPIGEWIGPIVVFMMDVLRWLHGHIGNYGWSIVALTVLISLILSPLRHYGIANGRKMAKMAPEMKVIQERYRKVPISQRQEMQNELADLYAKHGMNMGTQMMVGCLPILVTMPFLIAVYRVLNVSIDLRGAGFLWIPDLSYRDPLFLTPALMAGSMFLTQKLTPTSMDPAQQRMMAIMPLMLLAFVSAAPAGLNLYWFVSNVCSIIQQLVTLRLIDDRGTAAAASGGGGKGRRR